MKTLGETAYNAYCAKRQWKSVGGASLPDFKNQQPDLKDAWEEAANAVQQEIMNRALNLNPKDIRVETPLIDPPCQTC